MSKFKLGDKVKVVVDGENSDLWHQYPKDTVVEITSDLIKNNIYVPFYNTRSKEMKMNQYIAESDLELFVEKAPEPKTTGTFKVSKKRLEQVYIIAQANTPLLLEKEVNRLVGEGFNPVGGLVYDSYPEAKYPYKQAMEAY